MLFEKETNEDNNNNKKATKYPPMGKDTRSNIIIWVKWVLNHKWAGYTMKITTPLEIWVSSRKMVT